MTAIHRHGDLRECGATTVVTGQGNVYANGKLISVDGDPNTHIEGDLIASGTTVFINNINVIVVGDTAEADQICPISGEPHCTPGATTGSGDVEAY